MSINGFKTLLAAILLPLIFSLEAYAVTNVFLGERWYQGTGPGSQGYSFIRRSADGYGFATSRNFDQGITVDIAEANEPGYANNFEFVGTTGPLAEGVYQNVRDWPGAAPGMRYSISTGGITNFIGEFNVLEVQYGVGGTVERLAIDFLLSSPSIFVRQFDRGRLRINSSIPIPEPGFFAMIVTSSAVLLFLRRR